MSRQSNKISSRSYSTATATAAAATSLPAHAPIRTAAPSDGTVGGPVLELVPDDLEVLPVRVASLVVLAVPVELGMSVVLAVLVVLGLSVVLAVSVVLASELEADAESVVLAASVLLAVDEALVPVGVALTGEVMTNCGVKFV